MGLVGILQALSPIAGHHYGARRFRQVGFELQQALWLAAGLTRFGLKPQTAAFIVRLMPLVVVLLGLAGVALLVWPREATPSGHFGWQAVVLLSSLAWAVEHRVAADEGPCPSRGARGGGTIDANPARIIQE